MTPIFDHDFPKEHFMQFKPKTESEIALERLFPAGEYDFEVATAVDTVSKTSGKPMMKVELNVFSAGVSRRITDYLMESMAFKLLHFARSIGLAEDYEAGGLDPLKCIGRPGRVVLKIEEKGDFPPKNVVKDYAPAKDDGVAPAPKTTVAQISKAAGDDSIPF